MYSLRQKTWGVFIRPYVEYGGNYLVQKGNLYVTHPCQNINHTCTQYVQVSNGQGWILYKGEYLTSFPLVRERIKEVMDELGYSKNDIMVTEVVPIDYIVTPLT